MADGAPGAYGLLVIKSVVKGSVFALVPVQIRPHFMGTVVVPIIMSQGSVLLIDALVSITFTCMSASQSVVQSVFLLLSQLASLSVWPSFCPLVSHSFCRSASSQSVSQTAREPTNQPMGQSVARSLSE